MLNLYKKFDRPNELPLYNELNDKFELLKNHELWNPDMVDELKPVLHIIKKSAKLSEFYAYYVLDGRWPEMEPLIAKASQWAYSYSRDILANDSEWTSEKDHENGRWPEAEPYMMTDPEVAVYYAMEVLDRRWPEAEQYIKKDPEMWEGYVDVFDLEL